MASGKVDSHFKNDSGTDFAERVRRNRQKLIFDARFRRFYRMLHFIACRVLGGSERAEEAIGSCWRLASRHPQVFEHEDEFRGWLLRVLISEAASPRGCANDHTENVVRTGSCGGLPE